MEALTLQRSTPPQYSLKTGFSPGYEPHTETGEPVIRVGSSGNEAAGRPPWVGYRYHGVLSQVSTLEHDREIYGDCYINAKTRKRVDPLSVTVDDLRSPAGGDPPPEPKTVELTPEGIRQYLDDAITRWRANRSHPVLGDQAVYYIDAFQSMRVSLFGETLA
jgi:hypothetical protein